MSRSPESGPSGAARGYQDAVAKGLLISPLRLFKDVVAQGS